MEGAGIIGWVCLCGRRNDPYAEACVTCGAAARPAPLSLPAQLVPLPGQACPVLPIDPSRVVTLGRAPDNELVVGLEPTVSSRHARLYYAAPSWVIEDLESTNGSYVNGQRVFGRALVQDGDLVQLGQAQFQFRCTPGPPAFPAAPVVPTLLAMPSAATAYPTLYAPIAPMAPRKDRVAAGLLAILLGGFGAHMFYLGRPGWGVSYLLTTLLTPLCACPLGLLTYGLGYALWLLPSAVALVSLIQGIVYLCTSEAEFHQKYVVEGRLL